MGSLLLGTRGLLAERFEPRKVTACLLRFSRHRPPHLPRGATPQEPSALSENPVRIPPERCPLSTGTLSAFGENGCRFSSGLRTIGVPGEGCRAGVLPRGARPQRSSIGGPRPLAPSERPSPSSLMLTSCGATGSRHGSRPLRGADVMRCRFPRRGWSRRRSAGHPAVAALDPCHRQAAARASSSRVCRLVAAPALRRRYSVPDDPGAAVTSA